MSKKWCFEAKSYIQIAGEVVSKKKTYPLSYISGPEYDESVGIGSPKATAKIERFFETIKYESLNFIPFISINELLDIIHSFVNYYNNYRTHQSLLGFTPNIVYEGIKI